jgi:hypothetical protein
MITTQQPYDITIFQKQEERRKHQKSARGCYELCVSSLVKLASMRIAKAR